MGFTLSCQKDREELWSCFLISFLTWKYLVLGGWVSVAMMGVTRSFAVAREDLCFWEDHGELGRKGRLDFGVS